MTEDTKLNARVATEIMGWELLTIGYFGTESETPRQRELAEWIDALGIESVGDYWVKADTHFWLKIDYWKPTTDISQAWQVLEKFGWDKYYVKLEITHSGWECMIRPRKPPYPRYWAEENTAPMAIVLAALKTLEFQSTFPLQGTTLDTSTV